MTYLDPTNDFAFFHIFGNEHHTEVLISFLNSMLNLEGSKQIIQVSLINRFQAPEIMGAKETILDVRCRDQRNFEYIVEMQVFRHEHFDKRVLYYASKAYSQQLSKAAAYKTLRPVIFLGIVDFVFTKNPHFKSTHLIQDIQTRQHLLTDFSFTFIELPKFQKKQSELKTIEDKWIYFLKEATNLEDIPESWREPELRTAFEAINQFYWSREKLAAYDKHLIDNLDQFHQVDTRYKEGKAEGETEKAKAIAIAMLRKGIDKAVIAEMTGLNVIAHSDSGTW